MTAFRSSRHFYLFILFIFFFRLVLSGFNACCDLCLPFALPYRTLLVVRHIIFWASSARCIRIHFTVRFDSYLNMKTREKNPSLIDRRWKNKTNSIKIVKNYYCFWWMRNGRHTPFQRRQHIKRFSLFLLRSKSNCRQKIENLCQTKIPLVYSLLTMKYLVRTDILGWFHNLEMRESAQQFWMVKNAPNLDCSAIKNEKHHINRKIDETISFHFVASTFVVFNCFSFFRNSLLRAFSVLFPFLDAWP